MVCNRVGPWIGFIGPTFKGTAKWLLMMKQGSRNFADQPCLPQSGPYEAPEGVYPVTGRMKTEGVKRDIRVDKNGQEDCLDQTVDNLHFVS